MTEKQERSLPIGGPIPAFEVFQRGNHISVLVQPGAVADGLDRGNEVLPVADHRDLLDVGNVADAQMDARVSVGDGAAEMRSEVLGVGEADSGFIPAAYRPPSLSSN